MRERDRNNARRKLLKLLATGSGAVVIVPDRWLSPVVDTVVLPAHAETTANQASSPEAPVPTYGLSCRAYTDNSSIPYPQAPCSDTSSYGHDYNNDVRNIEALVDPSNDGGTIRLVATGDISGQIVDTTAIVSGGSADFGDITLPPVEQRVTFVFSCVGFSCSPNPSTTLMVNAFDPG